MDYKPKFWKINYTKGSYLWQGFVWGIPLSKNEFIHFKLGWSRDGIYGRGYLASAIDDNNVLKEIIKNYAIIARYRALGKKIISIGDENNIADVADINQLKEDFETLQDEDHLIINKPFRSEPLSYTGENDAMDSQVDFLRRDISSGLVPNFLTPWNSEVNRATAGEVKIPFQLELEYLEKQFIDFLNKLIIGELRKVYTWLAEDATFQFGSVDLESKEDRMRYGRELYDAGIITFNEFRKSAGYIPVDGGDKFIHDLGQDRYPIDYTRKTIDVTTKPDLKDGMGEAIDSSVSNKTWKGRLNRRLGIKKKVTDNYKIIKQNNIGGKVLRLVNSIEDDKYLIYNGIELLKEFELDEKPAAISYYEVTRDKLEKLQEEFVEGETPEDKIVEELYKELKREYAEMLDEFFKELENNKTKKQEAFLSSGIFGKLNDIFSKFDSKVGEIIKRVQGKMLGFVISPPIEAGNDTNAEEKVRDMLEDRGKMLMQSKTADQIKTFNKKAAQDIQRMLADGITAGQKVGEIKQNIKDKYVNWKVKDGAPQDFNISRIVRTEMNSNINLLRLVKWVEQGFEEYEWLTVGDERVRPEHRKRNHRVFKIKDALDGKEIFPGGSLNPNKPNINCRCRAVLYG